MKIHPTILALIEALPQPAALAALDGAIEIANARAGEFGLGPGRIAAPWLAPLIEEARHTRGMARAAGVGAVMQRFEGAVERFFLPLVCPLKDADGALLGFLVLVEDVTHERQMKEAASGFSRSVSHQLKTPLTAMQMSIHLLMEDARLSPRQLELLQAAREETDRLLAMINELFGPKK